MAAGFVAAVKGLGGGVLARRLERERILEPERESMTPTDHIDDRIRSLEERLDELRTLRQSINEAEPGKALAPAGAVTQPRKSLRALSPGTRESRALEMAKVLVDGPLSSKEIASRLGWDVQVVYQATSDGKGVWFNKGEFGLELTDGAKARLSESADSPS